MARTKAFDETTVLEKARDLFWKQGYTATSIKELEEHLGISRSSLYRFFGGKRALYDRTLAIYQHEGHGQLRKALAGNDNVRQALRDLLVGTALQSHPECKSKARGCYVVNATTELANICGEALNFVAENRQQFAVIVQDALARAQVQGQLDPSADSVELADYVFMLYNGLQVVVQTGIERTALVRAVERGIAALPWLVAG
ncbi:MAG: TetR/AcrR family transcriptional regulator [Bacteroidota bacterium]